MQQIASRSSLVGNRRGSTAAAADSSDVRGGGSGGGGARDAVPLFRRGVQINNSIHMNHSHPAVGVLGNRALEAMRQFAAEASAIPLSGMPAEATPRPRTTGSVHHHAIGGGGGRRQSTGSLRGSATATAQQHYQQQRQSGTGGHLWLSSASSRSNALSVSARPTSQQQQHIQQQQQHIQQQQQTQQTRQQQQQHRPRLSRNLTLSDLNEDTPPGGDMGRVIENDDGSATGEGNGAGLMVRREWHAGTGAGSYVASEAGGATLATPRGLSNADGRPSIVGDGGYSGEMLSRLPMLESLGGGHQSQHQQRHYSGRNTPSSAQNAELYEHGMSFGVSAVKGRRPYMEDEFKVQKHPLNQVLHIVQGARSTAHTTLQYNERLLYFSSGVF